MKLILICPQCGKMDWIATELAGEPIFQCEHCETYTLPEEMVVSVEGSEDEDD